MESADEMDEAAERLIEKVRTFAESLDEVERPLFAALIAPGVAAAWSDSDEVEGFGSAWSATRVQRYLQSAIRNQNLRIEGLSGGH